MLDAALRYAAAGWQVFPVYEVCEGACACGDLSCKNPGKHPRTPRGHLDATTDAVQIETWWRGWPQANIGVSCAASGLAVVDIDPRNGGDKTIDALEAQHGPLASPLVSRTGGGGSHRLFRTPADVILPGKLGDGIELKHNGYILAPPSNHKSGSLYAWEQETPQLDAAVLPPLPSWVLDRSFKRKKANPSGVTARALAAVYAPSYGTRIADRCALMGAFRSSKGDLNEPIWRALIGVLAFCEDGERLAHAYSEGERYDEAAVDDRLHRAREFGSPITCQHIASVNPGPCEACPHRGRITSPIILGRESARLSRMRMKCLGAPTSALKKKLRNFVRAYR
jgi:hypothetical protein